MPLLHFIRLLCPAALLLLAPGATAAGSLPPRPNVLLILADDLGYSDLGCYGGEIATPHLDGLAAGGLRFTRFYNTGRCWPTRAAVFTGYYAQQVRRDTFGARGGARGVRPPWAPLLPARLRPLGYRSYHSGKWHLDGEPLENGFDRAYTLYDQDRFFTPRRHTADDRVLPPVAADAGYYSTTQIADHTIRMLREHAARHAGQPFFVQLSFTAPHFPLHGLPEDIARYRDRYTRGWDAMRPERFARLQDMDIIRGQLPAIERDLGPPYAFPAALAQLGPNEIDRPLPWAGLSSAQRDFQADKMAIHAAMVDRMDREIGRVLDQLRAMGAFDNTLILFLSDNGASAEIMVRGDGHDPAAPPGSAATYLSLGPGWSSFSNTPFRRHKTWVHEGGIATPLIVQWRQGIRARGELRHAPGHVVDVVPTVLELVGGKPSALPGGDGAPPFPGRSLVPLLAADSPLPRDPIWFLHDGHRALRAGEWKLVSAGEDGPWELYHVGSDPTETHDLAARHPERVQELAAEWTRQAGYYRTWAEQDAPPEPPAKAPAKKRPAK
jgi:arylsulfatase A-like enzyme